MLDIAGYAIGFVRPLLETLLCKVLFRRYSLAWYKVTPMPTTDLSKILETSRRIGASVDASAVAKIMYEYFC